MNKKTVFVWVYRTLSILLVAGYLLTMFTLGRLDILPALYFAVLVIVTAPTVGWLAMLVFRQSTPVRKRNIASVLAVVLGLLGFYVFTTLYATASFLAGLDQPMSSYHEYSIIAKKDRHISLPAAKSAALLKDDVNKQAVIHELGTITKAAPQDVDNLVPLMTVMNDNGTDLGVLQDSQLDLLRDNNQGFYDTVEVLATFKVKVDTSLAPSKIDVTKPFVLYVSGIDTYGKVAAVARSDVNMLVVVNPRTHKILLVNTPRDYYVQLPGTTGLRDKLTHAGIYGIDTSLKTMEGLYGITIDSYIRVNFSSLIAMVDKLGGITVYSDQAFKSFAKGYNNLNGTQALEFSRERYSFAEGDRMRGKNQQRVIEAIIQKMQSPAVLTQYTSLLTVLQASIETNISGDKVTALVNKQIQSGKGWATESISVDGQGAMAPTYSMGDTPLYVMVPDETSLATVKQKINLVLSE